MTPLSVHLVVLVHTNIRICITRTHLQSTVMQIYLNIFFYIILIIALLVF